MDKPGDIPQDVWDAARHALFGSIPADAFAVLPYRDVVHMGRCARAILTERERCALIADEHRARIANHDPEVQAADLVGQGYGNAAFNIAFAIRKGSKP